MIDFKNGTFVKLKQCDPGVLGANLYAQLLPDEKIISAYKGIRDYVVFTDKRFISVNVQGITGKKQDFTSMPYKKISVFSIETSGTLDLDSELELYFSGVGKVKFEFAGKCDTVETGKLIASYAL